MRQKDVRIRNSCRFPRHGPKTQEFLFVLLIMQAQKIGISKYTLINFHKHRTLVLVKINHRPKKNSPSAISNQRPNNHRKNKSIAEAMQGSLHSGDAGAGAGDALPCGAAGVAATGGPAGQLRRAVPGGVEIPQGGGCKKPEH
jgi:hypothetical protein